MSKSVTKLAAAAGMFSLAGAMAAPAFGQTAPAPTAAPAPAAAPAAAPAPAAPAAAAAPASVTLNAPGMDGPLAFPATPYSVDVGPLGKWYVDAVVSGLGYVQSNSVRAVGDRDGTFDLSNGQVFIQKVDGWWQFYAQVGAYSLPVLGAPYLPNDTSHALNNYFSAVPQAFLKLAPFDNFSISAGKLPTLIGAEYTFTFENFNIERGLLWNQEPAVSRGVQATYTQGPLTFNISLTDGYYSNRYNWLTGSAAWTINPTNTLTIAAGGNLGSTNSTQFATPTAQNNSSIYNIIYTYNSAPWIITPYVQIQDVPRNETVGISKGATAYSGALLVNYAIDSNWSIAARGEFLTTTGDSTDGTPNITFYGPGSKAWSLTITPTWQYNRFFARGEFSVVSASSITPGDAFGKFGDDKSQFRGLLETGIMF
jgi:hypothetical protein